MRDPILFNQVLLARLAWRLIQNPESLDARLLKAIYYPRGNMVDTLFRAEASPAWNGIEHGLELLKKGIIWRIGDGKSIRIWRDNWLPRNFSLKPAPTRANDRHMRVSQLVSRDTNEWDTQLANKIFHPHDAETILQMHESAFRLKRFSCMAL